jgi:hypothetical protein
MDASHFTIEYQMDGIRGILDGYFEDTYVRLADRPMKAATIPAAPAL